MTVKERIEALLQEKKKKLTGIPDHHIAYAIMEDEIDDCDFALKHLDDLDKLRDIIRHTTSGSLWRLIEEVLCIPFSPVERDVAE